MYAVEPSAEMRRSIAEQAPDAVLLPGDLASAAIPEPVDFGLINHVYYHVPEHDWGRQTLACAGHLSADGLLCIAMKHPDAGCGDLMEHFGGSRWDLYSLVSTFRRQDTFSIELVSTPGRLETKSFDDTVTLARFVLSDRPASAYARLGGEAELEAYVRDHFWDDAAGRGGWANPKAYALVRRNPLVDTVTAV